MIVIAVLGVLGETVFLSFLAVTPNCAGPHSRCAMTTDVDDDPERVVMDIRFPRTSSVDDAMAYACARIESGETSLADTMKILGPPNVCDVFGKVFPGLLSTRGIGTDMDLELQTVVITAQQPSSDRYSIHKTSTNAVYVGGHVAGVAAALHGIEQSVCAVNKSSSVIWLTDDPAKSVAAGSAHYGHERDSVAIDFDSDLGPSTVLLHTLWRNTFGEKIESICEPHWLKVVLHCTLVPHAATRPIRSG